MEVKNANPLFRPADPRVRICRGAKSKSNQTSDKKLANLLRFTIFISRHMMKKPDFWCRSWRSWRCFCLIAPFWSNSPPMVRWRFGGTRGRVGGVPPIILKLLGWRTDGSILLLLFWWLNELAVLPFFGMAWKA